ncbi:sperm-associated antigen 5 [Pelodytes ibericus]
MEKRENMLSPKKHVSAEKTIPSVHRKSIRRTPLQDLTAQRVSLSERRITRSSSKKSIGHTTTETSSCNTSTPVRIWVDPHPIVILRDCLTNGSKELPPCSLLETKFSKLNIETTSTIFESKDVFSHPCGNGQLIEPRSPELIKECPTASLVECNRSLTWLSIKQPPTKIKDEQDTVSSEQEIDKHQEATIDYIQEYFDVAAKDPMNVCGVDTPVLNKDSAHYSEIYTPQISDKDYVVGSDNGTLCPTLEFCNVLHKSPSSQLKERRNELFPGHSGELSPVVACLSPLPTVNEVEAIFEYDKITNSDDTYEIDSSLKTAQMVEPNTSPKLVLSYSPSQKNVSDLVEKVEAHSLPKSNSFVRYKETDLQTPLKSDSIEHILSSSPPNHSHNLTHFEEPPKVAENNQEKATSDHSKIPSKHLVPEDVPDKPTPGEEHLALDGCVLQQDTLAKPGNDIFKEPASACTSRFPDPVLLKKESAQHCDYNYIPTEVADALTPFLSHRSSSVLRNKEGIFSTKSTFTSPVMRSLAKSCSIPISSYISGTRKFPGIVDSPLGVATCITPTSTASDATWTTPIMLLNKSINTSWNVIGKGDLMAKDNASETDSLLWNFSRESLHDVSREELMSRLEGTVIVIEVLSRQLQDWQQNICSSKPSEQRDASIQTCVTYTTTEEPYYHDLYIKTFEKLRSMQRTHEEERQMKQILGETMQTLESHKNQSMSMVEFAETLHEISQKDKKDLNQMLSQSRTLIRDHMTLLSKMKEKMQLNVLQGKEMKTRMENALYAKEAMDQCLKDLEIHSSTVIAQLQRDLESEKQLGEAVRQSYEQQLSYNEELVDFAHLAQSVGFQMKSDRAQLQLQCTDARETLSQHWKIFEIMKERTQTALLEQDSIKSERDQAYLENEELCSQINCLNAQNDKLMSENNHLSSELTSLMEHLCNLESETERLKQDRGDLMEDLSAKTSSLKLLEKELNEATARGVEIQTLNKELSNKVVPRLELDLSQAVQQNTTLLMQLQDMKRQAASQIVMYNESVEFLEQENGVCREQTLETETQLKANLFALRERNLQCETQRDQINGLKKVLNETQEELNSTRREAQDMLLQMCKDLSESSLEVSTIKENLQTLTARMQDGLQGKLPDTSCTPQTPARSLLIASNSLVGCVLQAQLEGHTTDSKKSNTTSICSETSAFTIVQPVTSQTADDPEEHLPDLLRELNEYVLDFAASSSKVIETKEKIIKDLNREIFSLEEQLQSTQSQHKSDIQDITENIETLKRKNKSLDEILNGKQQCIHQLGEIIQQQEQKILRQICKEKESEEIAEENSKLKRSLQLSENEVSLLKDELVKNQADAARDWIQEKLLLHKELTKLRLMLIDTENSKSEMVHRAMRHRDILEGNLCRSEKEVKKLDDILEKIRETLLSVPDIVSSCEQLRQLMKYLK